MKKSKYLNKQFGNWICTEMFLAANYGGGTKHNYYKYLLTRITTDGVCDKIIVVSGNTLTKIAKGIICPEEVANHKKIKYKATTGINNILYKFIS